jgi:hypothetical protein
MALNYNSKIGEEKKLLRTKLKLSISSMSLKYIETNSKNKFSWAESALNNIFEM